MSLFVELLLNKLGTAVFTTNMRKLSFRDVIRVVYRMLSLPIIAIIVIIPFLLILLL